MSIKKNMENISASLVSRFVRIAQDEQLLHRIEEQEVFEVIMEMAIEEENIFIKSLLQSQSRQNLAKSIMIKRVYNKLN